MRRRAFISLLGASITWPFAALAQEPGRTYRIGCLQPVPRDVPGLRAFFDGLRSFGFIEGQNLLAAYLYQPDAARAELFMESAGEFLRNIA
jgi:hypothetical protein